MPGTPSTSTTSTGSTGVSTPTTITTTTTTDQNQNIQTRTQQPLTDEAFTRLVGGISNYMSQAALGQAPRQSITDFLSTLGETYNIPQEEGNILLLLTSYIIIPHVNFPYKTSRDGRLIFWIIIPHINFPCKPPCNFDYHPPIISTITCATLMHVLSFMRGDASFTIADDAMAWSL